MISIPAGVNVDLKLLTLSSSYVSAHKVIHFCGIDCFTGWGCVMQTARMSSIYADLPEDVVPFQTLMSLYATATRDKIHITKIENRTWKFV